MSGKKKKNDLQKMYLAGTVSVPPRLPGVAGLTFETRGKAFNQITLVKAEQDVSLHTTVTRTFFLEDVTALFVPDAGMTGDLENGKWYIGAKEISGQIEPHVGGEGFDGVIFVREHAQSLLETRVGLTASENAEYYLPMPADRSVPQYNLRNVGCLHDECDDFPENPPNNGGNACCSCGSGGSSGGCG